MPGDSPLLVDLGNGRLTVLTPEGDFVDWIPMALSTPEGRTLGLQPGFVDGAGKLYARSIRLGLTAPPDPTNWTEMKFWQAYVGFSH